MEGCYYEGEKINLRGIKKEDYTECLFKWANDPEFNYYLSMGIKPSTLPILEKQFEKIISTENAVFAIVDRQSKKTIGLVGLYDIAWQPRLAEYRIHIGEKEFWGTGASSEATEFILKYAFETLNLNKVWLGVNSDHQKALKLYERIGFIKEGILRQEIFRNNKYYNITKMGILRNEYKK